MADAMALCAAAQALGSIACHLYFGSTARGRANESGTKQRPQCSKRATEKLGKKSKKVRHSTGADETKRMTDKESKDQNEAPKNITKRATDKIKAIAGSKKKKEAIARNLELERENEILKKQLHAEQDAKLAEQRRVEKEIATGLKTKEDSHALEDRLEQQSKTALAQQRLLDEQSSSITKLNEENAALKQVTLAEQRRVVEQVSALQAENNIASDGRDHTHAVLASNQQELRELKIERGDFKLRLEEMGERVALAEKRAASQILTTEQAGLSVEEAEDKLIEVEEKLFAAEAQIQRAQEKIAKLETQAKEDQATIRKTGEKLDEANSKIAQLDSALQDEEENFMCLEEENEKLKAELAERQALVDDLRTSLDSKNKTENTEDGNSKLKDVNDDLQKQLNSMKTEITKLKDSLDISEGDALQAMADVDAERAEKEELAGKLKEANERIEQLSTFTVDFSEIDDITDPDELREKLTEALQQVQDTQEALAEANERLGAENLTKIGNIAQMREKDEWIENLEYTVGLRDYQFNEFHWRLARMQKLVEKDMDDFTPEGVENDRKLRQRCVTKNMQQHIPSCDYLFWELHDMELIAKQV